MTVIKPGMEVSEKLLKLENELPKLTRIGHGKLDLALQRIRAKIVEEEQQLDLLLPSDILKELIDVVDTFIDDVISLKKARHAQKRLMHYRNRAGGVRKTMFVNGEPKMTIVKKAPDDER